MRILHRHLQEKACVKKCLQDRPGHSQPALVVLDGKYLACTFSNDPHELSIQLPLGSERLELLDDFTRRALESEDFETLMIEAINPVFIDPVLAAFRKQLLKRRQFRFQALEKFPRFGTIIEINEGLDRRFLGRLARVSLPGHGRSLAMLQTRHRTTFARKPRCALLNSFPFRGKLSRSAFAVLMFRMHRLFVGDSEFPGMEGAITILWIVLLIPFQCIADRCDFYQ